MVGDDCLWGVDVADYDDCDQVDAGGQSVGDCGTDCWHLDGGNFPLQRDESVRWSGVDSGGDGDVAEDGVCGFDVIIPQ